MVRQSIHRQCLTAASLSSDSPTLYTYAHTKSRVVSIFGLVVYLLGIVGATVWYSATHYQPSENTMEWRWRGLPHFFGVAVYALEVRF